MELDLQFSVYNVRYSSSRGCTCLAFHENIEKIFINDIREKKRAGSGAFHMRGKGVKHGFSGALRTPYHYMSNREKKKLNGEVEVFNMYETIIPINEFELKDKETQKHMLTRWRELYDNDKIVSEMEIGKKIYYDLISDLEIPKKARGGKRAGTGTRKKQQPKQQQTLLEFEEPKEIQAKIEKEVVKTMLITKGLHLEYNGQYDVDALNRLFTKLQLLVDGESCKYNISLSLSEIQED